jgi:WD40 repeat protein
MEIAQRLRGMRKLLRLGVVTTTAVLGVAASLLPTPWAISSPHIGGAELWVARYNGPDDSTEQAYAIAASPDASKVFVTGRSPGDGSGVDYATVAYDAQAGSSLWVRRYNGPGNQTDEAQSVAVSPDGSKVFVTGYSWGVFSDYDYATLAYDAATGAPLWLRRYNGRGHDRDTAQSVVVSSDGSKVVVTGQSILVRGNYDYATLAYDAETGSPLWVRRYNGASDSIDQPFALAASPNALGIFVTGRSYGGPTNGYDYATLSYGAATVAPRWVRRYDGPAHEEDWGLSLAVSPDGALVFVSGFSSGVGSGHDYATVAYDTATGAPQWVSRYNGPENDDDEAQSIVVSPDGARVFVTGFSEGVGSGNDYATVAYDAAGGAPLWVARYNGPDDLTDQANSIAVTPDGSQVFVTGFSPGAESSYDYATIAYDAASGAALWVRRYDSPEHGYDRAYAVAMSPDGSKIFVTGETDRESSGYDYLTIAYEA